MFHIIKFVLVFTGIIFTSFPIHAEIHSEVVNYQIDGQPFRGYLSYDKSISEKRPGILVVHEWWGHNTYARKRAEMLAKMGYTAFALDMYGAGKFAEHPDDAQKFMQEVITDISVAELRFNKAKEILQNQSTVDATKIAAIGYCFGGGTALHMARKGTELAAVVSFHGSLSTKTPAQENQVKSKILVFNGDEDPFVTREQISLFKQEMLNAKVDLEFINYPGAKHSFTNPDANDYGKQFNMPLAYNAEADSDSWKRMSVFFEQLFQQ